jgi:hypothetical protein
MDSQANAKAKNSALVGNNEQFFDEWKHIIVLNDGKRSCDCVVSACHDEPAGFEFSQKTRVSIPDPAFDDYR